ncbi:hypothetical protein FOZ60_007923 [Perkinsus olseni]|uniref:Uncharacterized protein n=1 Tax=Perkinsus olseni TaxID=32597 RepID=A0A7J6NKF2_PEROL|nr:hypothetical protein FOZ60_007923 [Perkinsus olseni]
MSDLSACILRLNVMKLSPVLLLLLLCPLVPTSSRQEYSAPTALCNSSDPALLPLQELEVFTTPMAELWHSVKPLSVDLAPYEACPVLPFIVEMIALLAQFYNKGDQIPPIRQLSTAYPRSTSFMVNYPPSVIWTDTAWRRVVFELLAAVSARLRPHLGSRQDVIFECAVVHRHRAVATVAAEVHVGELRFSVPSYVGSSLLPLGATLRDLTISSRHCPPETATAIVSTARGWLQLGGSEEGVLGFLEVAEGWVARENPFRLLAMSSPYFEYVHAVLVALHQQALLPARLLPPRPGAAKRGPSTVDRSMGFDCGGVVEARRIQNEFLEAMVGNSTPSWPQSPGGRGCEIASVIALLAHLPADGVASVDRTHLASWHYLQSVNSQWWRPLKSGWGLLLANALADLHARALQAGLEPRRLPKHCKSSPAVARLRDLSAAYLSTEPPAGDEGISSSLPEAMSLVGSVSPDCSVAVATALQLALNHYVAILVRLGHPLKAPNATHPLATQALNEDVSGLVEVIWQTVAGEKLAEVLSNELPLFELMRLQWRMLFSRPLPVLVAD